MIQKHIEHTISPFNFFTHSQRPISQINVKAHLFGPASSLWMWKWHLRILVQAGENWAFQRQWQKRICSKPSAAVELKMATFSHLWLTVYLFILNVGEEDHTVQVLVESMKLVILSVQLFWVTIQIIMNAVDVWGFSYIRRGHNWDLTSWDSAEQCSYERQNSLIVLFAPIVSAWMNYFIRLTRALQESSMLVVLWICTANLWAKF